MVTTLARLQPRIFRMRVHFSSAKACRSLALRVWASIFLTPLTFR
jgi:hypothetical protein